jgi:hypothetical protein
VKTVTTELITVPVCGSNFNRAVFYSLDRHCGPWSEFLTIDAEARGSIPGATRFSDQYSVCTGPTQPRENN